jgi:uncharacterized membrane protein YeaQ/YmgE (transglycosylase-associated protein family)
MGILVWVVTGAIVGWLGFRVAGYQRGGGCLTDIVVGIAGAMFGGAALAFITGEDVLIRPGPGYALLDFVFSVLGAALLILILRALGRRENDRLP